MFIDLSKALPPLLYQPGLSILLLLAALLIRRRRPKLSATLILISVVSLYALSTPALAEVLQHSLETHYPALSIETLAKADAIVVLGGYLHEPSPQHPTAEFNEASDRLRAAAQLFRAEKASAVLLSGGTVAVAAAATVPEAQAAKGVLQEWGVPSAAIQVEDRSQNTHENAIFSVPLLADRGARRVILVTSANHMPRAVAVFKRAGLDVIPFPTDYQSGWGQPDPLIQWFPDAEALWRSNRALKEWIGLAVYRSLGWA